MKTETFVYVIGGVPGVGKTSMAGRLAARVHADIVLSGDYLREFLRPYDSDGIITMSVYDAWKMFGEKSQENIIKGYLRQSEYMSTGIRKVIDRAKRDGEKIVLETLYFNPDLWGNQMSGCRFAYLYVEHEEEHKKKLLNRTSYTHINGSGVRLAEHLYEYRLIMYNSLKLVELHGFHAIETTNYMNAYNTLEKVMVD